MRVCERNDDEVYHRKPRYIRRRERTNVKKYTTSARRHEVDETTGRTDKERRKSVGEERGGNSDIATASQDRPLYIQMLDWFRLSPSPRSCAAGVCLSGQGGHLRGPLCICSPTITAVGGRTWEGGEPPRRRRAPRSGSETQGLWTSRVSCSNRAASLQQVFKVKSGSCTPVCTQSHDGRPGTQRSGYMVFPLGIGVHQGDQGAPQRQGHDGKGPCPHDERKCDDREQALASPGTVAEDARRGGDDGQG